MQEEKEKLVYPHIKNFKSGDKDSFSEIYCSYRDSVYYFAITLTKNNDEAEEVVQDTFLKVYKKIDTLKDISKFRSWVFSIAYNTAMSRRNSKHQNLVSIEENPFVENDFVTKDKAKELFDKKELTNVIEDELMRLPEALFITGQLFYFDNLTMKEVANVLGIPVGTVKNRLNRVRSTIKPKLEKKGYSPNKYFSLTALPVLAEAYAHLQSQYIMNPVKAESILATIKGSSTAVGINAVSSGFAYKALLSASVLTVAVGGYFINEETSQVQDIAISDIEYNDSYTNNNVNVSVHFDSQPINQHLEVIFEDNPIYFEVENNNLNFTAYENGEYTIQTAYETKKIQINQIDQLSPELNHATYDGNQLYIDMSDDYSGIDYENSYILYNEQKYNISNITLPSNIKGQLLIVLVDNANNKSEYQIEINEITT